MESIPVNSMKKGNTIRYNGDPHEVVDTDRVRRGMGRPYVQVKLRRLKGGGILEVRFNSAENVERLNISKEKYTYSYDAGHNFIFMHGETFEEMGVPHNEVTEAQILYLKAGDEVEGEFCDDEFLRIVLPKNVVHEVKDTPPAIKGATATNQLKPATTETGLELKVPPFVAPGDRIRIDTDTGAYVERAKD